MKEFLLFLLFCVSINAQTIYINSVTGNDASGNGTSGNPYKTFTKGYSIVNAGGVLNLTGTFTWTDAAETGDAATTGYTIDKNITILGQGADQTVIQAASSAGSADRRLFSSNIGVTVLFQNLEMRYGNVSGQDGGALYLNNGNITILNCYIHHNTARQAGAIISFSGTINITNSTIANNSSGGGPSLDGGGILKNGGSYTITNTTICNNICPTGFGGGMSLRGGSTIITNCTIVSNTSSKEGGGITMENNTSTVAIKNTIIANNISNTVPSAADFDRFEGTLTDNGYNIVEVGNASFSGTGSITGNQANLFGTGIGTTPALGLNNSVNKTPTFKTVSGSVAINAGNNTANGSVSIPTTDQRGGPRNGTTDIGAYEYWDDAGTLPVELTSFTANVSGGNVLLNWQTKTEVNNYGFEIERASLGTTPGQGLWEMIGFVNGSGNSNSVKEYSFTDKNLTAGNYSYRLKQIDNNGSFDYSEEIEIEINNTPLEFNLEQNYPNPFNPATTISYQLPADGMVTMKIYDVMGNEVETLVNEYKPSGRYTITFNASNLASGIYFYKLNANDFTSVKKFILMK